MPHVRFPTIRLFAIADTLCNDLARRVCDVKIAKRIRPTMRLLAAGIEEQVNGASAVGPEVWDGCTVIRVRVESACLPYTRLVKEELVGDFAV